MVRFRFRLPSLSRFGILVALWVAALGFGFRELFIYANAPGEGVRSALDQWPAASKLHRDGRLATLVAFLHPKCPCSVATIGELERLLPHTGGKARLHIVLGPIPDQHSSNSLDGLSRDPAVVVSQDPDGIEAAAFSARTSGQVYLFDRTGCLVFRGGITPARGHRGDSDGRAAILHFLKEGLLSPPQVTHVFGCSLLSSAGSAGKL